MRVNVAGRMRSTLPATDDHPYRTGPWRPQHTEYDADELDVVGTIPADLDGVYLRNTENPVHDSIGNYHPFDGDGMLHATSTFSIPRFSSPSDSASVFPHSWVMSRAMSVKLASSSAFSLNSGWMRSPAGVRRHAGSAAAAAATALPTSAADDRGALARTSPVAGFVTGIACVAPAASHWPPM